MHEAAERRSPVPAEDGASVRAEPMIQRNVATSEDPIVSICGVTATEIRRRCEARRATVPGIGVGGLARDGHPRGHVAVAFALLPSPRKRPRGPLGKTRRQVKRILRAITRFARTVGEVLAALPKLGRMRRQIKELRTEVKTLRAALGR